MAMEPDIFLEQEDAQQLLVSLNQISFTLVTPAARQALLTGAGVSPSSISNLHFDPAGAFASELTAYFRTARVSDMQPDYHPMVNVLSSLLATTPLEDQTERLFRKLITRGQENLKAIRARSSVGRLESPENHAIGTGVLLDNGMVLTCYHVLQEVQGRCWIRFGYKKRRDSWLPDPGEAFELAVEPLVANSYLDYALLKIIRGPEQRPVMHPIKKVLDIGQKVYLIHHPLGHPIEVSNAGQVTNTSDDYLDHNIPSQKGSSGAPLFDRDWHFVAIHSGDPLGRTLEPGTTAAVPLTAFWDTLVARISV